MRWWTWQRWWPGSTPRDTKALLRKMEWAYGLGMACLYGGASIVLAGPALRIDVPAGGGMAIMANGVVLLLEAYRLRAEVEQRQREAAALAAAPSP